MQREDQHRRAVLHIDLDARFADDDNEYLKLTSDENGFITLEGEVVDDWFVFDKEPVINMNEIRQYIKIQDKVSDDDYEYWPLYIAKKKDERIFEVSAEHVPIYYRESPITVKGIALIDGWFCFRIY